jgi:chemotaxis protein MotB
VVLGLLIGLTGCVAKKKYVELNAQLEAERSLNDQTQAQLRAQIAQFLEAKKEQDDSLVLQGRRIELLTQQLRDEQSACDALRKDYEWLKSSSSREMLNLIQQIEVLRQDVYNREVRLNEIRRQMAERDSAAIQLRDRLRTALVGFEADGITVSQRGPNVVVSLSDKLLFRPGRTDLSREGRKALLELARALKRNPELSILVEGHTDDQPVVNIKGIEDNWDLSVLRATSVIRLLVAEGEVDPRRFQARGRSYYEPVGSNATPEGRRLNRRTEILLAPDLESIYELVKQGE